MEGMLIRYGCYRILFKSISSFAYIYSGVYFSHTYGISIGSRFSVNSGTIIDGRGGVAIGNDVMIGPNSCIYSSSHDMSQKDRPMTACDHILRPVVIQDDVWIGANVSIPGGVTIGSGAVIAAGAVVVKDVEPGTIVGGVPARMIRSRFDTRPSQEERSSDV
jgi:maltose O-acetyltransferase